MEFFKFLIFGIAGVSLVFWVAVITLWHVYMFPRIFKEGNNNKSNSEYNLATEQTQPILGSLLDSETLPEIPNRRKYSMKSLVVADFSGLNNLKLDSLYTIVSLSVVFASFTLITYGLHSGFPQI